MSKEGVMPLSKFKFECRGLAVFGNVVVEGEQNTHRRWAWMRITAFDRIFEIDQKELQKLGEYAPNGVLVTSEMGYPELGGRTLYLQLLMGFSSGIRQRAMISVTEDGQIQLEPEEAVGDRA
jgi:hypothetical protein